MANEILNEKMPEQPIYNNCRCTAVPIQKSDAEDAQAGNNYHDKNNSISQTNCIY